jgi:hypothetical protein
MCLFQKASLSDNLYTTFKTLTFMKQLVILFTASALLFSCKKDDHDQSGQFKGPEVEFYHGKAWSSFSLDKGGKPLELTISLSEAVLNSVPVDEETGGGEGHTHDNTIVLPLPAQAIAKTPFKTLGVDWNAAGHPPAGVYTLPHFDFHFYMVTEAERLGATDETKLNAAPPTGYLPANHAPAGAVPQMGMHWVDLNSPELNPNNPATFTQTFIYGSYNSKITFYEPMATLSFLNSTTNFERSIPQPSRFEKAGYYPTKMKILKRNGVTEITLTSFQHRNAS